MNIGMCDICNSEPAVACNDDGDFMCEDCFFEDATNNEFLEESE